MTADGLGAGPNRAGFAAIRALLTDSPSTLARKTGFLPLTRRPRRDQPCRAPVLPRWHARRPRECLQRHRASDRGRVCLPGSTCHLSDAGGGQPCRVQPCCRAVARQPRVYLLAHRASERGRDRLPGGASPSRAVILNSFEIARVAPTHRSRTLHPASVTRPACDASRSLRALMEFARNDLISVTHIWCKAVFRFAFLRSDLFRHHMKINLSNLPVLHARGIVQTAPCCQFPCCKACLEAECLE